MNPETVKIKPPYIELDSLLKFTGMAETGGEAKILIKEEKVTVNGEVCTMRKKKIRSGDIIEALGKSFSVTE